MGGSIARWIFGLAWSLATALIVPVLVFEEVGVGRGIKRSSTLFRKRWGETVTAMAGTGVAVLVASLALCPVIAVLAAISVPLAMAAGVGLVAAVVVVSGAFNAVLTSALYQYAVDGKAPGPFQVADLEAAWKRKP